MSTSKIQAKLRLRLSQSDAHYGGNLVAGSRIMDLFGDLATELLIRLDGDEGLFRAYDRVEFLAPSRAGDYLEVEGEVVHVGNTSRKMLLKAWKVIEAQPEVSPSAARVLDKPILVAEASGTCVTPLDCQRNK